MTTPHAHVHTSTPNSHTVAGTDVQAGAQAGARAGAQAPRTSAAKPVRHRLAVQAVSGAFLLCAVTGGAMVGAWLNHDGAQAAEVPAGVTTSATLTAPSEDACSLICSGSGGAGTVGQAPSPQSASTR